MRIKTQVIQSIHELKLVPLLSIRLTFFFFVFTISFLKAQVHSSTHYSMSNGLVSNEVYDIFEDKDGFIWIGTDKGVNRFDSYRMKTFTLKDGLADKNALYIRQDSQGKIWFLSYNGKLSY